ncbi:MAG: pilin [Candidatus Paceibacterota bacterium]|jgi:hypothetical protein
MKTKLQKIILSTIIVVMLFSGFTVAHAINDYTIIAPLPKISGPMKLGDYLPAAFNLSIGIAAALAFLVITWGGITYATSDAISGKQQGKEWITNAIWGLVLVIGAWIILSTINPQILRLDLILKNPSVKTGETLINDGVPLNKEQLANDTAIRNSLNGVINVNSPACVTGATRGCTNVNGLPGNAITGLVSLNSDCGCNITITGGTEGGHKTHGVGKPIVDLRPDVYLNKYLTGSTDLPQDGTSKIVNLPNGQRASFTYEALGGNTGGTSTGKHWHVVIE